MLVIHHEFFNHLDDELFSLSDKAENSALQTVYFEAMRFIRKDRGGIENNLQEIVLKQFDEFWNGCRDAAAQTSPAEYDEDNFSLIEYDVLEEDLAVTTMIDKMNQRLHAELYGLNRRFAALLGQMEICGELNPVGPYRICHCFAQVIKPLLLDLEIKLLIYKFYDKFASSRLDIVYKEINAALVKEQILPKLTRNFRLPQAAAVSARPTNNAFAEANSSVVVVDDEIAHGIDSQAEFQAFQKLQSMLDAWRVRNGFSAFSGTGIVGQPGNPVHQTDDVLNVLTRLQVDQIEPGIHPSRGLKLYLSNELRSLVPGNEERPLAAPDEDIIDMVGMIFDFILDDEHLPDAVKALIGRLQIPVIKVAILEKGFFSRRSHPARELLNKMAKAGSRLDAKSVVRSPLVAELASIVDAVLTTFDHQIDIFSQALERLNVFLEKDRQRTRLIEDRTRQVIESKEQLEIAKSKIGYALIRCIQGKELPVFLRSFLNDAWKHVMLLAYLRKEKSITEWEGALGVVTRLIWTITPVDDIEAKRKILQEIPQLLKDICIGLENISFDPHKTSVFFKHLETCQMRALNESRGDAEAVAANEKSSPLFSVKSKTEPPDTMVSKSDRSLAAQIDALIAGMSKVDDSLFSDLEKGIERDSGPTDQEKIAAAESGPEKPENDREDEYSKRARTIEVGQWLSFKDEQGETAKAKLSWKSPVTARYIFVNTKGAKFAEKSLDELAQQMRNGSAILIEDQKIPAMDRAVAAMMRTLENVGNKPRACVEEQLV
ncbi:MAG: DUF1631 domain-containing protein [Methylococcaceae bacterium]|nr:DUF1631 domain-containing protein [Methylococcaceae bacterium]